MAKTYSGVCTACGRESLYLQRVYRVPKHLGGERHRHNLQELCVECRSRKATIEHTLMTFNAESADITDWYQLAFQNDPARIEQFLNNLHVTLTHLKEIAQTVTKDGQS